MFEIIKYIPHFINLIFDWHET